MRSFPSARAFRRTRERVPVWAHPQWLVTALAVVVAIVGLAVPLAQADDRDDLRNKQNQVQGQIAGVKKDIDEASRTVARLSGRLAETQGQLTAAKNRLAKVQSQLSAARAQASSLATQLATAQQQLVVAQRELTQAKADVKGQRAASRATLITLATNGDPDLAVLSSYVGRASIEDILVDETAHDVITGRQQQALDQFEAIEAKLSSRRAAVQRARDQVAGAKAQADANVATISGLVGRAARGEAAIARLVRSTATARAEVSRARAADRAALKRLEKREATIRSRILALSRRQKGSYSGSTNGLLAKPGPGPVTSPYGYRIHPIYGYYGLHNGIDFGTGCGAPLVAGESGTVVSKYYDEVYGNRLYVAIGKVNGASITLVYNHATNYVVGQGDRVRRGQTLGYSGSTGWSTGCHLHFIVLRNGEAVDPAPYL